MRYPYDEWPLALQQFAQGCKDEGFPECKDHNAPNATGIGPLPRNQGENLRASTLVTYLKQARGRPNLRILDRTRATRVLFQGRRATGVEVERDGSVERLRGDRVVLSAGAIKTPQILTLSGIGPKDELRRLGIELLVDAPGVGRNLADHPSAPVIGLPSESMPGGHGFRMALSYGSELGPRSDLMILDAQIQVTSLNFAVPSGYDHVIYLAPMLGKPHSRGWLRMTSADPKAEPEIHLNFLSDASDLGRLMKLFRLTYELASSPQVKKEMPALLFPPEAMVEDDELTVWLLENVSTSFHGAGTCRMGPDGEADAVVSERLDVHGVQDLYVADASVMPEITTGFTNLTCYMIGGRAADWLKGSQ